MRFHCLQHVSFETPGLLADVIRERGSFDADDGALRQSRCRRRADLDVLIIMGGPMSIHDEAEYPWLRAEKELIAASIREGKKVLGICLGAQLIAAVCGARVYPNPQKEIGFWPMGWRNGGFGPAEEVEMVFHWHGETFDLPEGAVLLASTEACVNQAFSLGDRVGDTISSGGDGGDYSGDGRAGGMGVGGGAVHTGTGGGSMEGAKGEAGRWSGCGNGYELFEYSRRGWGGAAAGGVFLHLFGFIHRVVYIIEYHRRRAILLCFRADPVLAVCGAGGLLGAVSLVPRLELRPNIGLAGKKKVTVE